MSPPFNCSTRVKFFSCSATLTTFSSVIVIFAISLNYENKKLKVIYFKNKSKMKVEMVIRSAHAHSSVK